MGPFRTSTWVTVARLLAEPRGSLAEEIRARMRRVGTVVRRVAPDPFPCVGRAPGPDRGQAAMRRRIGSARARLGAQSV
ncbi:hypothetical protein GCM10022287_13460 [Gryllotalpicola koreensis]|uniref:Uncharacterized protein n=1 Tax=Gryllotalpicola koreensis TaxID=993086 RepID=A0ABP7ZX93_9MICO